MWAHRNEVKAVFFKPSTPTGNPAEGISKLKYALTRADAVVIGAGAGLSTSAGFTYTGDRFERYFADFYRKYGFSDMYTGGFYPYATPEEHWAYWSRYIYINRYMQVDNGVYSSLVKLLADRNAFSITTNVDHQWQLAGWSKERLFYTQGDYGLWQCSKPCHHSTYDNEDAVREMVLAQGYSIADHGDLIPPGDGKLLMRVPTELVPRCPICHRPMSMNLRADDTFVQDSGWEQAARRYHAFLEKHRNDRVLYLELGVGYNTPGIIKYPFRRMTYRNPNATYACINFGQAEASKEIEKQSICINSDIKAVLNCL